MKACTCPDCGQDLVVTCPNACPDALLGCHASDYDDIGGAHLPADVPPPQQRNRRYTNADALEIGQHITIPATDRQTRNRAQQAVVRLNRTWGRKQPPRKYSSRIADDGVQIWRVA